MPRPVLTSQNGEDHLLLAAFSEQSRGFFIDVGAFDGVHLSNTHALERAGWRGYCIEPVPWVYKLLSRNRPKSICINAASGQGRAEAMMTIEPTGLLGSLRDEDSVREAYRAAAQRRGLPDQPLKQLRVPVHSLDDLIRKHAPGPTIDLVSIDVEGFEMSVLSGFDIAFHKPRVIIVEANDDGSRHMLLKYLTERGYSYCRTLGNNLFFAYEAALIHRLHRTPIACFLPRNLHPLGETYTHPDQRTDRVLVGGQSIELSDLSPSKIETLKSHEALED